MNFSEHPELGPRWLYHIVTIAFLGSMPVMLYFFRRFRWL
jgi:Mg2+ and Co2+ transporter CorA